MSNSSEKNLLREQIKTLKNSYSPEDLASWSDKVFSLLEQLPFFPDSKNILIYNSLKNEVQTADFIQKWLPVKRFFLPVVKDDNLVFREYNKSTTFHKGSLNVMEPNGNDLIDYSNIDMVIIPGIAFDKNMNRLGRGKGYYDRFLSRTDISAVKIGVCFEFQLFEHIPTHIHDIKMNYIITERCIIENQSPIKNNK